MNEVLKGMGQAKKSLRKVDLLRLESFSCDHVFLNELLSICAYGMPPMEVRLSVVA